MKIINSANDGKEKITVADLGQLKSLYHFFVFDILGLRQEEATASGSDELVNGLMDTILSLRQDARVNKDFATSDKIRDAMQELNIRIKDTKDGAEWEQEY